MSTFDNAVAFVLAQEGGYVADPVDPGGRTNFGISQRAYPNLFIPGLTRDDAVAIYRRDYWDAARCDDFPAPLALVLFDAAVNQGVVSAIRILQKELGVLTDGIVGPQTLAAVRAQDVVHLTTRYCARRALWYTMTLNFGRFGLGWMRRLFEAHRAALAQTKGDLA